MHVSVAAYLGINKPKAADTPKTRDEVVNELTAIAGPARSRFVPPVPIKPAE